MRTPRFDDVLDACIEDVCGGRRTIAECVAAWPQFADELEALLETALAASATRALDQVPSPAARAVLMARVEVLPQQCARSAVPAQVMRDAMATPRRVVQREYARELVLLHAAGLRAARQPLPAIDSRARAQFMAELADAPQERRRRVVAMPRVLPPVPTANTRGFVAGAAAALVAFMLVLALSAGGPATAEASTLTVFAGEVQGIRDGRWVRLDDRAGLAEGTRLRTDAAGRALLTFARGMTVSIEPSTELTIERADGDGAAIRQVSGRLWHQVGAENSVLTVTTPDAVVSGQRSVFETAVSTGGVTEISAARGQVEVVAGLQRARIGPGESVAASSAAGALVSALPPRETSEVNVQAPFQASLVGPSGKGTSQTTGGEQQEIPGALSVGEAGGQTIVLGNVPPGDYTLVLRRTAPGEGAITVGSLAAEAGRQTVSLPSGLDRLELTLTVDSTAAATRVTAVGQSTPVAVAGIVATEEPAVAATSSPEQDIAAPVASAAPLPTVAAKPPAVVAVAAPVPTRLPAPVAATSEPTLPAAEPTAVPTPTAIATPEATPTAEPTVEPTPTATPTATATPEPTVTPTPAPTASPEPTSTAPTPVPTPVPTPLATATPSVPPPPVAEPPLLEVEPDGEPGDGESGDGEAGTP